MCRTQLRVSAKCVVNWHRKWTASTQIGLEVSDYVKSRRRLYDYLLLDFEFRCCCQLQDLGDRSMIARQYHEAISQYTTALALNPVVLHDLLGKRSEAHAGKGEWEDALSDANEVAHFSLLQLHMLMCGAQVIKLDPSSPLGYERKHAALHGIGRHDDATSAFETMLLKMSESSDPGTCGEGDHVIRVFFF